jgi:ABC-type glycerol-3-phosphate transport system permease component
MTMAAKTISLSPQVLARKAGRILLFLLALMWAGIFVFPFIWTVSTSLKTSWAVYEFPPTLIPKPVMWSNYVDVFVKAPVARWIGNTLYIVVMSTVGGSLSATVVAYSFARLNFV